MILCIFQIIPGDKGAFFAGCPVQIRLPDLPHQFAVRHDLEGPRQTSISSAIASWMTSLSSSTVISVILRFAALITSPSYVNPFIIVEKSKENNYVCQEKSVFPSPIASILEQSGKLRLVNHGSSASGGRRCGRASTPRRRSRSPSSH